MCSTLASMSKSLDSPFCTHLTVNTPDRGRRCLQNKGRIRKTSKAQDTRRWERGFGAPIPGGKETVKYRFLGVKTKPLVHTTFAHWTHLNSVMKFLRHLSWHTLSIEPLVWVTSKHRLHITSLVIESQSFLLGKRDTVATGSQVECSQWGSEMGRKDVKVQAEISHKEELVLRVLSKQRFL